MTDESSDGAGRRHSWRIGRLVCGLAAVIGLIAAVPAVASAQPEITGWTPQPTTAEGPPGSSLQAGSNCPTTGANPLPAPLPAGGACVILRGAPSSGNAVTGFNPSRVQVSRNGGTVNSIMWWITPDTETTFDGTYVTRGCATTGVSNASADSALGVPLQSTNGRTTVTIAGALVPAVPPTLPSDPGSYHIFFQTFSGTNCTSATASDSSAVWPSGVAREPDQTVTVTPPVDNAHERLPCGLRVALVLDESFSIHTLGGTEATRLAALHFVQSLEDTGAEVAIIPYSQTARVGLEYTPVTSTSAGAGGTFDNWLFSQGPYADDGFDPAPGGASATAPNNLDTPRGDTRGTNWQAGLHLVPDLVDSVTHQPEVPNLVLFVTDGDPNGIVGTTGFTTVLDGGADIMGPTVGTTNGLKEENGKEVKVFAVGVGPDVNSPSARARLRAVSGPTQWVRNGSRNTRAVSNNFLESDWTSDADFSDLAGSLEGIVSELCEGTLTITKNEDNPAGWEPAPNWRFTVHLDSSPTTHTWTAPPVNDPHGPTASADTNDRGEAFFSWSLHEEVPVRLTVIHETEQPGWHSVYDECMVNPLGNGNGRTQRRFAPARQSRDVVIEQGLEVPPGHFVTCEAFNTRDTGTLTVVKSLDPEGDPGLFNLHIRHDGTDVGTTSDAGDGGYVSRQLPLGTYAVSEAEGTGTSFADYETPVITCVDLANPGHVIYHMDGPGPLDVRLTSVGQHIQCTIHNVSNRFGEITVIKHLIPANDSGRFYLYVAGNRKTPAVGDGGTTGPVRLPFGSHAVTETGANGTDLGHYNISTTCIDEHTGDIVGHNPHGPTVSVALTRAVDDIQCTIQNERPGVRVGRLEVIKHLVPTDDAGRFDLLIGGTAFALGVRHNGTTGPLDFELGTHTVTEHGAHGTDLADFSISTTCVDRGHGGHTVAHNAHGPSVSVHLTSESDNIVCTITNRRTAPPGGGELTQTELGVTKTMPPESRVGELVPITLVVHNHGHGVAHGVQLVETRPPGLQIVHVADHGRLQSDGSALWTFGNLAPGESRTVHATARVLHTGRHVDMAVASALNADPAFTDAAVRARAAVRPPPPPPFTG